MRLRGKTVCLLTLILAIFTLSGKAQTTNSEKVKKCHFKGFIFKKEYLLPSYISNNNTRFTPTLNDVEEVEEIVKMNIKAINMERINQVDGNPIIDKKLRKYKRQYFGYFNEEGERIIWVNFVWDRKTKSNIADELAIILDGGSYYWNIKVNLDKKKLFDLFVNSDS